MVFYCKTTYLKGRGSATASNPVDSHEVLNWELVSRDLARVESRLWGMSLYARACLYAGACLPLAIILKLVCRKMNQKNSSSALCAKPPLSLFVESYAPTDSFYTIIMWLHLSSQVQPFSSKCVIRQAKCHIRPRNVSYSAPNVWNTENTT